LLLPLLCIMCAAGQRACGVQYGVRGAVCAHERRSGALADADDARHAVARPPQQRAQQRVTLRLEAVTLEEGLRGAKKTTAAASDTQKRAEKGLHALHALRKRDAPAM
jgi:hypothetical protein